MASSLSNLVNNISGEIHRITCKFGHDDKKCETCRIKFKYCDSFLEYVNVKCDLIERKCLFCNKSYQRKFNRKLKEQFFKTNKFSNHDNNKFILLLRKAVYPYEYMNYWGKFNKVLLHEKQNFYSHLNIEDITDAGYIHTKRVSKD